MRTLLTKSRVLLLAVLGSCLMWAYDADAVTVQLCIKASNTCSLAQADSVNVAGLEDSVIKIENISGQTAKVEADNSGANDRLSLKWAKITFKSGATYPVSNYEIEITGTGFTTGPNLAATPSPNYRLTATNQHFKRGALGANLDVVKAKGFVMPSGGAWNQIGGADTLDPALVKYIYTNSYYFFNGSYLDEGVAATPDVNRDLRINLWLTAQQSIDVASFPSAGLELKNTTAPGGAGEPSDCDACGSVACPPGSRCVPDSEAGCCTRLGWIVVIILVVVVIHLCVFLWRRKV